MRYMQVIEARDVQDARHAYLELLGRGGIEVHPAMTVYVETIHRSRGASGSWLCYIAQAVPNAA